MPLAQRLSALLLLTMAAASASAQQLITTSQSGSDVVIEAVDPVAGCGGDLYRDFLSTLPFGGPPGLPPVATGMSCPYTFTGDALLRGDEDGRFYVVFDPVPYVSSNMGFCLERHFDVRTLPSGVPTDNVYLVSTPLLRSQPDVANTAAPETNKCVGDVDGPGSGDGLVNADDLICSWWMSRDSLQGSFMISRRDEPTASWFDRTGYVDAVTGNITFGGPWTDELADIAEGYLVTVDGAPGTENRFVITGAHDPSNTGRLISPATDTTFMVSLPYNTMYLTANELICGLEGVEWVDADSDGDPDMCPGGIFDETHQILVATYDNIIDGSPGDGAYLARTAAIVLGRLVFTGIDFPVIPGEAYFVMVTPSQGPRTFLSPHY